MSERASVSEWVSERVSGSVCLRVVLVAVIIDRLEVKHRELLAQHSGGSPQITHQHHGSSCSVLCGADIVISS